ncbi:MAG: divalent-cation tolerance protein CutA [Candidatus Omnitrophica bacterium]|jgi:periplasmic divalent cation tolerance protein|nr:divalent-cation tolerance protein CutA [Candidatus Omnitrophota bacterium]
MHIIIFVTAANKKEAKIIAESLIREKLAACVNIVAKVDSLFWWKQSIERAAEILLIIKSRRDKFSRIVKLVKKLHSYQVPEIIALPIIAGEKKYLRWIDATVR